MVLIGRKLQIDTLEKYAKFTSLILLYGHPYTGKSIVLHNLLQERLHGQLIALVNGKMIYSTNDLYREVLLQLRKWLVQQGHQMNAEVEEDSSVTIKDIPVDEQGPDESCISTVSTIDSHDKKSSQSFTGRPTRKKLNFITFFRLLMQIIDHVEGISTCLKYRTVFIALDHAEYLVERNVISELPRLLRTNDQLKLRMVCCEPDGCMN